MLITLIVLLSLDPTSNQQKSSYSFIWDNYKDILAVLVLNATMLLLGYLGEIRPKAHVLFVFAGIIPFLAYFNKIFNTFVLPNEKKPEYISRRKLFFYFFGIWSLYAIAAMLPYEMKNTMYNILDLFAKNFLGVFLVYLIKTHA